MPVGKDRLLLHSVSFAGLWGQAFLPVDQFLRKAAELGFGGVMLMAKRPHVSILDYDAARRVQLRRQLEELGLRQVVLAGYNNFTADLEHGEVPHREIQVHYVVELARLAADIGAQSIRIFTGYEHPAADITRQWNLVADALREIAKRTRELGVVIGLQNHHDLAVGWESFRDLLELVGESNMRAMFDAWAPALQQADLAAAAKALSPLTIHTTIADYQLRPRYRYNAALVNYEAASPQVIAVPMGSGMIDYRSFLRSLDEGGFSGTIAYEMCSPLRDGSDMKTLETYAQTFLEYFASI